MVLAKSKLTAQGQISVPVEVRKRLGIGPGSILEWDEQNDEVVVRRAGHHSSEAIHHALFVVAPTDASAAGVKEGIKKYIRKRHARG
jgi:AbrB family looped-hinge helix DNA binding protein